MNAPIPTTPWTALLLGRWVVPVGSQHEVARAVVDAWQAVPWPNGLLAHTVLADDSDVTHLSFATDDSTFNRVASVKRTWNDLVDTAVPGVQRLGVQLFDHHRSVDGPAISDATGCVVLVRLHASGRQTAADWIDQLASTAAHRPGPEGLIAAHFHLADDGHILNVAEWTSDVHHQRTLLPPATPVIPSSRSSTPHRESTSTRGPASPPGPPPRNTEVQPAGLLGRLATGTRGDGMGNRLAGKVALITGTGGGQGRAAAELFCAEGAAVIGCDVNADNNEQTVEAIRAAGGDIVGMAPVDLGSSEQARRWVADAATVHGRIDIVYNNAAAPRFAPFADLTDDDWHYTVRNELDLIFYVTQAAWPHLCERGGVILNTASVQGVVGIAANGGAAHAATKAGVIGLTRQLAAEGAPHGIRANSISPGTVATAATAQIFSDPATLDAVLQPLLIKRLGTPEDMAALALFLVSDDAAYITGANFLADGGLTAT